MGNLQLNHNVDNPVSMRVFLCPPEYLYNTTQLVIAWLITCCSYLGWNETSSDDGTDTIYHSKFPRTHQLMILAAHTDT